MTAMAERLHTRTDATVRLEGVPYPVRDRRRRTPTNVFTGVNNMRKLLRQASRRAVPTAGSAMVGFSQGAQTVHGFAIDLTPSQIDRMSYWSR